MQGLCAPKEAGPVVGDGWADTMVERPVEGLVELEGRESRGENRQKIQRNRGGAQQKDEAYPVMGRWARLHRPMSLWNFGEHIVELEGLGLDGIEGYFVCLAHLCLQLALVDPTRRAPDPVEVVCWVAISEKDAKKDWSHQVSRLHCFARMIGGMDVVVEADCPEMVFDHLVGKASCVLYDNWF
jgi:hypothetical protein